VQGENSSNVDLATETLWCSCISIAVCYRRPPAGLDGSDLRCRHNRTHARESGEAKNASAKTGAKTKSKSFSDRLEKQTRKQNVSFCQR
jgi:hypothetical protein